jgi:hypothetical protein
MGMPFCGKRAFFFLELRMATDNSRNMKDLVDTGMETVSLGSDEINDFLTGGIFSPEDAEDVVDFLSEPNVDIVEAIQERVGSQGTDWGETDFTLQEALMPLDLPVNVSVRLRPRL